MAVPQVQGFGDQGAGGLVADLEDPRDFQGQERAQGGGAVGAVDHGLFTPLHNHGVIDPIPITHRGDRDQFRDLDRGLLFMNMP
ncbi:hypothetical protein [Granulicoccus phenolivorans]|uniref:hypothetical protein n=1 Tax=Granulicoccus phenolivorans TaxID=266854 RepID=UPI000767C8DF|nr:hypothetical protein [Granulicoccus phenolivorans]